MVDIIQLCVAGSVCFHISHVALMPCGCVGPGMRLIGGIEMRACGTCIGCAAIAELMHVESVLSRRQAGDLPVDVHAISDGRECDDAAYFVTCRGMKQHNCLR